MDQRAGQPAIRSQTDPLDRILHSDDAVCIGLFDCPRSHPRFRNSGPASGDLVVFPRDAVEIRHDGREPVVANRHVVTLYNLGQEYRRGAISDYGDRCLWLRFPRAAVVEAMIHAGRTHPALEKSPFDCSHGKCPTGAFVQARYLMRALLDDAETDSLHVQEMAYQLLYAAVGSVPDSHAEGGDCRPSTQARHRRLAARCKAVLASRYADSFSLTDLAARLATTPFHLSRVFSAQTGTTVHKYLMGLRLRAALDLLIEQPERRLTDIGAELGFATPSHFTQRFRQSFGQTPAAFRRMPVSLAADRAQGFRNRARW